MQQNLKILFIGFSLAIFAVTTGCGTSGGYSDPNNHNGKDPCKGVVEGYPCSPYGHDLNDTVLNMTFYKPPYGDEDKVTLSDYVKDKEKKNADKIFLVSSFARWCSACMQESPQLYDLFKQFKDRGVVLLMTMNDGGETPGTGYAQKDIITGAKWWLENILPEEAKSDPDFLGVLGDFDHYMDSFYDVSATPLNMILSPRFTILYKRTGWDGEEKIANLLDTIIKVELENQ
ncbi:MAG: redoxin domain-containing protein [Deltaproteobacteria bacterium]|nr:redoxin domain-containing protein [Deltaproteobacteria bacterium]